MDTTGTIVLALMFLILPAVGAISAFQKNRRIMGIAIIATAITGFGWILAIFAFVQSPKYQIENQEIDTPCPKCGGVKGAYSHVLIDKNTQKSAKALLQTIIEGLLGIVLIGGCLWLAIDIWQTGDSSSFRWNYGSTLAGIGVLSLGINFGRFGIATIFEYLRANRAPGTAYRCNQCKNEWTKITNENIDMTNGADDKNAETEQVKDEKIENICQSCGYIGYPKDKFCRKCGNKLPSS